MMLGFTKACLVCGADTTNSSRCDLHQSELLAIRKAESDRRRVKTRPSNREQGRDAAWRRLSERARRMQGYCSDCAATTDLTCDHTPRAWWRKSKGLPIRISDVDVVCRGCNNKRGPAKPGTPRFEKWAREAGIAS